MARVVGIDSSLTSFGCALGVDGELVEVRSITSRGSSKATVAERGYRLAKIRDTFCNQYLGSDVDMVVIEAPSYGSSFGSSHDRSGLWWMVVDRALALMLPVALVAPSARQKYIIGTGRAISGAKDLVLAQAIERWGGGNIQFRTDDEADATGLCSMGSRKLGTPIEAEMPEPNLEAMVNVQWPRPK